MKRRSLLENLEDTLTLDKPTTIGSVLESVGDKGFGLLLMILSLPSALPVPAPGYSTPFGILICILAWQMLCGKSFPILPKRAQKVTLEPRTAKKMRSAASAFLKKIEHFIHPRLLFFSTRTGQKMVAICILIMAVLMILPIPMTNTAPAMVIFLMGIALCENDGLCALFGCFLAALGVCIYAVIIYYIIEYGSDGVLYLKDAIKEFLNKP